MVPDLFIFAAEVFSSQDASLPEQCSMYRRSIYSGRQAAALRALFSLTCDG